MIVERTGLRSREPVANEPSAMAPANPSGRAWLLDDRAGASAPARSFALPLRPRDPSHFTPMSSPCFSRSIGDPRGSRFAVLLRDDDCGAARLTMRGSVTGVDRVVAVAGCAVRLRHPCHAVGIAVVGATEATLAAVR
jgi:hypothetical protein